jgi:hypothetical protein
MINRKKQIEDNEADDAQYEIKITVKIGSKIINEDLETALRIPSVDKLTPGYVGDMLSRIPHLHARWNYLYNEAVFEYDIAKTRLEIWFAKKEQEIRKDLMKTEKGRVTDKMVDGLVKMDDEYESKNEDLAVAKKNMKHILALANGFGEKGEKLVNIASMMKWEAEILGGVKSVSNASKNHIKHYDSNENNEENPWTKK